MTASLVIIVEIAVPLALVVSLALRWLYLRAVRRSMLRPVASGPGEPSRLGPLPPVGAPSERLAIVAPPPPAPDAVRAAWRGPWTAVAVHMVAGLIYALTVTVVWAWLANSGYSFDGVVLFTLFFAWPLVIVIALVATVSWGGVALVAFIYAAVFAGGVAWLTQGRGVATSMVALNWWNINGIGTLLVLGFLLRPIKAMGPIVVVLMIAATVGVFGMADLMGDQDVLEWVALIATRVGFSGNTGGIIAALIVFGLAAMIATVFAYVALRGIGRLYQAQWISDQSIQIDAVWLTFAILQAPLQQSPAGLAAFLVYAVASRLGLRLLRPRAAADNAAPKLLLLRVFSLGARSERLFRSFSLLWRYTGSVRMIAGPDLANATVEPHEFLDFMAGRLQRRFISGPDVLERRLAETPLGRDGDGRFRVSSFFCHADTWQSVLRRLARQSDVVLMDLRGFNRTNEGCIYELNELVDTVRLEHLLLIVDGSTDEVFLTEVLEQSWTRIGRESPNRADAVPCVRLYRLSAGVRDIGKLVATLAAARSLAPDMQPG